MGVALTQDSSIVPLGIYPKDTSSCHRDTCSTLFISTLFVIAQKLKTIQMSISRCMDKDNVVNFTMDYYPVITKMKL